MISPAVHRAVESLGPTFRLPLRVLTAIDEKWGRAAALDHALQANDEAMRFVALLFEDTKLGLYLLRDLVNAQEAGAPSRVRRIRRRLTNALRDAKARIERA